MENINLVENQTAYTFTSIYIVKSEFTKKLNKYASLTEFTKN